MALKAHPPSQEEPSLQRVCGCSGRVWLQLQRRRAGTAIMAKGLKKRAAKRAAEQEAAAVGAKVSRARTMPEGIKQGDDTLRLGAEPDSESSEEELEEHERKEVRLSQAAEERIKTAVEARKGKKDKFVHNRTKGATKATPPNAGVVYLGHIPFGFFERQMTDYFGQFGDVTRLRISRSMRVRSARGTTCPGAPAQSDFLRASLFKDSPCVALNSARVVFTDRTVPWVCLH